VPDLALLRAGQVADRSAEESDGELVPDLARVRAGATATECEQGVEVDSFRVRTSPTGSTRRARIEAAA
jgi:hypothetical protein